MGQDTIGLRYLKETLANSSPHFGWGHVKVQMLKACVKHVDFRFLVGVS